MPVSHTQELIVKITQNSEVFALDTSTSKDNVISLHKPQLPVLNRTVKELVKSVILLKYNTVVIS